MTPRPVAREHEEEKPGDYTEKPGDYTHELPRHTAQHSLHRTHFRLTPFQHKSPTQTTRLKPELQINLQQ